MKQFNYFTKFFIFWLIYFNIFRFVFIIFYFDDFSKFSLLDFLKIIKFSLRLDLSFISYISVIVLILYLISDLVKSSIFKKILNKSIFILNCILVIITSVIVGVEISLYSEWGVKLNYKAISHLVNPLEVLNTATYKNYLTTLLCLIISVFFIVIYKKYVHEYFYHKLFKLTMIFKSVGIFFISLLVFVFLIRGGVQPIPINISDAYFSNHLIMNDVTVNPNWNLVHSILKSRSSLKGNPYSKYNNNEIENFKLKYNKVKVDSTLYVLDNVQPNIIFIILESWSADNISDLGGLDGITPNFNTLQKEGVLFTNFYSNGWTSDQAVSSIFSSEPTFPYVVSTDRADKARFLPSLNKSFSKYNSSFIFGGQLSYGNIKSYLIEQRFDIIKDINNYSHLPSGRLGIHDEYMFSEFKNEINKMSKPFMSTLFTLSSHSPYDFPYPHKLSFNSKEDIYVNSVAYTDSCLGNFIEKIKKEEWYESTLLVIVADHSHASPLKRRIAQKERYKIPMLWIGGAVHENYKGYKCDKLGSHIDISSTLLAQFNMSCEEFNWSNNLFSLVEKESFVPYAFHKGYGLIKNDGYYAFSESYKKIVEHHANDSISRKNIQKDAELFFQIAFQEYLDL